MHSFFWILFSCYSFAYAALLWFLKDVWIRTQRAAVPSRRATNVATHPPFFWIRYFFKGCQEERTLSFYDCCILART
jgi:hypothetical protein